VTSLHNKLQNQSRMIPRCQSYQTSFFFAFQILLLSWSVCEIRKYCLYFKMAKINSKKSKKCKFYDEKRLEGLTPETQKSIRGIFLERKKMWNEIWLLILALLFTKSHLNGKNFCETILKLLRKLRRPPWRQKSDSKVLESDAVFIIRLETRFERACF
jgi:hypothetical protein